MQRNHVREVWPLEAQTSAQQVAASRWESSRWDLLSDRLFPPDALALLIERAAAILRQDLPERDPVRREAESVGRKAVAHPNTPRHAIETATDVTLEGRTDWAFAILSHEEAPLRLVTRAAVDEDPRFRIAAAVSKNCPVELLVRLARDENADVRAAAAVNPGIPERLVLDLAGDPEEMVRHAVIAREHVPNEAIDTVKTIDARDTVNAYESDHDNNVVHLNF